jgi:phosphoserine phosphatase RsbU/P
MSDVIATTDATRVSRVIFEYASRIGREQDRDLLIRVIGDMGRDLVGADRCTIWLLDDAAQHVTAHFAHGSQLLPLDVNQGFVGNCIATGQAILSNSAQTDPRFSRRVDRETQYTTHNVLTVPMRAAGGQVIGAFQAVNKPGGFGPEDTDLLALAAEYSARTIETERLLRSAEAARRVARELDIARDVQQSLLANAHRHQLGGLEFVATCRPASQVGGDYYDLLPLPNGRVAIAVGDISGKGIAAALMMASVQATLHTLVLQNITSPAELLFRLNRQIADAATGQYSTLFVALYDREQRILTSANGGHVYPLVIGRGGVRELIGGGPPVGLLPNAEYREERLVLEPGDTLVCYSDGLTEAQNTAGDLWIERGLRQALVDAAGGPAADIVRRIMAEATAFSDGTVQHDDMTLVCLRIAA